MELSKVLIPKRPAAGASKLVHNRKEKRLALKEGLQAMKQFDKLENLFLSEITKNEFENYSLVFKHYNSIFIDMCRALQPKLHWWIINPKAFYNQYQPADEPAEQN
jgi:hypothetical protein